MYIRKANERGYFELDWLKSFHSFSFGDYHDPEHMGFSVLRVINDDLIAPSGGFAPHSHQNMEILTYVTEGVVEHKDSLGNTRQLGVGEIQLMSAGSGITHSEYNPSDTDPLKLLQIWIQPNELGIDPGYQQEPYDANAPWQCLVAPNGDSLVKIHQQAWVYRLNGEDGVDNLHSQLTKLGSNAAYFQVVRGDLQINGDQISVGDGLGLPSVDGLTKKATVSEDCEALVFVLPNEDH